MTELFPFLKHCLRDRVASHSATRSLVSCRVIAIYGLSGCGLFETSQPCQKCVDPVATGECVRVSTCERSKPGFLSHLGYTDIEYTLRPATTAVGAERKSAASGLDRTALYCSLDVQGRASIVPAGTRSELSAQD